MATYDAACTVVLENGEVSIAASENKATEREAVESLALLVETDADILGAIPGSLVVVVREGELGWWS